MIPDDFVDSTELCSSKATASLQPDRIEPELSDLVLTLNVNMLRFVAIARVEEQSIRAHPEYRRHLLVVSNRFLGSPLNLRRLACMTSQPQLSVADKSTAKPDAYPATWLVPGGEIDSHGGPVLPNALQ